MGSNGPSFKDLFSSQSTDYAKFRPTYPPALFEYLVSLVRGRELAWDVGTGNGQAAVVLAESFARVVATDPSAAQLERAQAHPRVEYRVGNASRVELSEASVDLVTVAQALHWFKQDEFFAEVQRVLKPGGVLAFWCYELARITPKIDAVVMKLYEGSLSGYWEPERKLIEEGYRGVHVPLREIATPRFEMTAEWSLEHLVGYLGTWSALHTYIRKNGTNPLEALFPELQVAWGSVPTRRVSWELAVRVGRKA